MSKLDKIKSLKKSANPNSITVFWKKWKKCPWKPCLSLTDIFWVQIKHTYLSVSSTVLFWLLQLSPQSHWSVQGRHDFLQLQILFLHLLVYPHLQRTRRSSEAGGTVQCSACIWLSFSIQEKSVARGIFGQGMVENVVDHGMVIGHSCMRYQCTLCWSQLLTFFAELGKSGPPKVSQ